MEQRRKEFWSHVIGFIGFVVLLIVIPSDTSAPLIAVITFGAFFALGKALLTIRKANQEVAERRSKMVQDIIKMIEEETEKIKALEDEINKEKDNV